MGFLRQSLSFLRVKRDIDRTLTRVAMQIEMSLGYAEARQAIDAAVSALQKDGKAAVVAVADCHGELLALARMDGASLPPITIAVNKAFTAAREKKPTLDIGQKSRDPAKGFDISYFGDPRYVGWGGGLPVEIDGKVVGAVAVSGLSQELDIHYAQIGVQAIMKGMN
jgi:glc operon protein GlcG